ncbi:MAG: hypothetical protein JXA42_08305 [Anaerolineales bacterium]|nr:hypothetical protein [Anaerolineales bacterium]
MSLWTAEIVSPGLGNGQSEDDAFRPQIAEDYPVISLSDVTGIDSQDAPDPFLIIVRVWCDESILQDIAIDDRYLILWQEETDHAY